MRLAVVFLFPTIHRNACRYVVMFFLCGWVVWNVLQLLVTPLDSTEELRKQRRALEERFMEAGYHQVDHEGKTVLEKTGDLTSPSGAKIKVFKNTYDVNATFAKGNATKRGNAEITYCHQQKPGLMCTQKVLKEGSHVHPRGKSCWWDARCGSKEGGSEEIR